MIYDDDLYLKDVCKQKQMYIKTYIIMNYKCYNLNTIIHKCLNTIIYEFTLVVNQKLYYGCKFNKHPCMLWYVMVWYVG